MMLQWSKSEYNNNWHESKKWAESLTEDGHTDWRLPSVKELMDVFDYEDGKPLYQGFWETFYWSGTSYKENPDYVVWDMQLTDGIPGLSAKTNSGSFHARAVREAKNEPTD